MISHCDLNADVTTLAPLEATGRAAPAPRWQPSRSPDSRARGAERAGQDEEARTEVEDQAPRWKAVVWGEARDGETWL